MGTWGRRLSGAAMMIFGALQLAVAFIIPFAGYGKPIKTWTIIEIAGTVGLFGAALVIAGYATFVRLRLKN
jgi:hypothetical protein